MTESERDTGSSQVIRRGDNSSTPTMLPDNGSSAVPKGKPPCLRGVAIPTNNTTARRRTYEAYWRWPLLPVQSVPLVAALFDNVERRRKLARARDALEAKLKAGRPKEDRALVVITLDERLREVEAEIGRKDKEIRQGLAELGWTPTSMARLGIDVARMSSFAAQMQEARQPDGRDPDAD